MEHDELLPLLSATAKGDKKAFAELYSATSGKLYAISLKMLKNTAQAEEALQDAFIKIWHNASDYQGYSVQPKSAMLLSGYAN